MGAVTREGEFIGLGTQPCHLTADLCHYSDQEASHLQSLSHDLRDVTTVWFPTRAPEQTPRATAEYFRFSRKSQKYSTPVSRDTNTDSDQCEVLTGGRTVLLPQPASVSWVHSSCWDEKAVRQSINAEPGVGGAGVWVMREVVPCQTGK